VDQEWPDVDVSGYLKIHLAGTFFQKVRVREKRMTGLEGLGIVFFRSRTHRKRVPAGLRTSAQSLSPVIRQTMRFQGIALQPVISDQGKPRPA
jgi:hypothetical protein